MTDNEIIKALECCSNYIAHTECPYFNVLDCQRHCMRDAIDLINRQQVEVERLKAGMKKLVEKKRLYIENMQATREFQIEQAKSEARKEFAEKIKEESTDKYFNKSTPFSTFIDNLLKEMG